MATANSTVPMPTVPPSSQPTASTVSSMPVRHSRIERPLTRASPVISPSRGPGPKRAPMYMPVAIPHSSTPPTMHPIRAAQPVASGTSSRPTFNDTPTSTTLLTVPGPGRCRSGIQNSRTAAPTITDTVPIARSSCSASPWWNTSHGSSPRPERTCNAPDNPYDPSPT